MRGVPPYPQGINFYFTLTPCARGEGGVPLTLPHRGTPPLLRYTLEIVNMGKKLKGGGGVIDRCDGASEHRRIILAHTPCTMTTPVTTPERATRARVAPNAPRHEGVWRGREKSPGAPKPAFRLDVPTPVATPVAAAPKKPAKTYTIPCRDCGAIWAEMCFCAKSDALWEAHLERNKKQSDASKP